MFIRTALTETARAELISFCKANLKAGLDPLRYADNYDADLGEPGGAGAVFEIPARHCRLGHVVDLSFRDDADFITEEIEV